MSKLSQISRIHHLFERKMLIMIINSLVCSKLYYCSTVWASISALNLRRIQCVQNFAARIVTGTDKFDHITPCLKALKWLLVAKKLYLRDAVMAFKCINGLATSYLCTKYCKRFLISGRVTRQSNNIQIPKCRMATGQRSFHYCAVTIWNSLSESIRLSSSLLQFKRL